MENLKTQGTRDIILHFMLAEEKKSQKSLWQPEYVRLWLATVLTCNWWNILHYISVDYGLDE